MRTDREHVGSVHLTSAPAAVAGEYATLQVVYEAGKYGIDDCGCLLLAWRGVSNMELPQFDRPTESGYTTAETDSACKLRIRYEPFRRPHHNCVKIEVVDGYLCAGEHITVTFGDTRFGSPGIRMQNFIEREFELLPLLDACGTERYTRIDGDLKTQILPAKGARFDVWAPGTVHVGEPFAVALRSFDGNGNIAPFEEGNYRLFAWSKDGKADIPASVSVGAKNRGVVRVEGCTVDGEGVYYVVAENVQTGKRAISSPCVCRSHEEKALYWGDMHGQTRETLGCGRLDDYLAFARDCGMVDVTGWQGNDLEITDAAWEYVREQTKAFNEEGKFLVFLGYEWSGTTNAGGDHNVYFLDDSEHFYPSSNWISGDGAKVEHNAFPITELHKRMENRSDVMIVPHIGGRRGNLDFYNEKLLHNIEVHSLHGIFEWFPLEAMRRRLKVGFIAASDDHAGRVGLGHPHTSEEKFSGYLTVRSGLTGIYADALTKPSVWDALTHSHCYGSTLDRIYLETNLDGLAMGDDATVSAGKKRFSVRAAGSDTLDVLELYDWDTCIRHIPLQRKKADTLRVRVSGVVQKNRNKTARWEGSICVKNGKILSAERCGYLFGLYAPEVAEDRVSFRAITNGDIKGYTLLTDMDDTTEIRIETNFGSLACTAAQLKEKGEIRADVGGENLSITLDFANDVATEHIDRLASAALEYAEELDVKKGEHAYWVRLVQDDGNIAWASPIFVKAE